MSFPFNPIFVSPSGLKSVQYGTISFDSSATNAATAAITSVNTSKSIVSLTGWNGSGAAGITVEGFLEAQAPRVTLTSGTVVTGEVTTTNANGGNLVIGFYVAEFS